jgi:GxxExxY protein
MACGRRESCVHSAIRTGCADGVDRAMIEDDLTRRIISCVIRVHQDLGPGFLESVYKRALLIEFHEQGLAFDVEKEIVIRYKAQEVGRHRLDLLVQGQVIVEIKAVETLTKAHFAQIRSYLHAAALRTGLLINFAADRADFRRIIAKSRSVIR